MRDRYRLTVAALMLAAMAGLSTGVAAAGVEADQGQSTGWRWQGIDRVVVVPDIHGAYDALVRLLQATGVVDQQLHWTGGDTHLVSLGDLLDRGSDSRAVMDLLMRLQQEAPGAGGRVHVVLGNHEQMNLIGDLRYVSAGEFAAFAGDETPAMRSSALQAFTAEHPEMEPEQLAQAFDQRYPAGYFAHREAFAPEGRYGRWLLSLPTLILINDTAFVHGGLPQRTAGWTPDQLNDRFRSDLRRYLQTWQALVARGVLPPDDPDEALDITNELLNAYPSDCVAERAAACARMDGDEKLQAMMEEFSLLSTAGVNAMDAPFWYRGSVFCRDILEQPIINGYLSGLGASRAIVGHTPTTDRRMRLIRDGRLLMTDTGMLVDYYKGRPAALVMAGHTLTVQYLDPLEQSAPLAGFGPVAYGLQAPMLERALAGGMVTAVDRETAPGYWSVTLEFEGRQIAARFFRGGRHGNAEQELAAYALDRLLGTELVAPTVAREVDGREGALQLVYPREISEQARLAAGIGFSGWCPMSDQFQLMNAFDLLIGNPGRTADNILYSRDDWTLRLSEHGEAFSPSARVPPGLDADAVTLAPGLVAALAELDQPALKEALGDYLDGRSIRALLKRRNQVLEKFTD